MLGHAVARQPAPMLAMRPIGLRLRHGVDALGSALGDAVVGSIAQSDSKRLTDAQIDKYLEGVVDSPAAGNKDWGGFTRDRQARAASAKTTGQMIDEYFDNKPLSDVAVDTSPSRVYVQDGDSLTELAKRWPVDGVSLNDRKNQWIAANPQLANPNALSIGQELNYPGADTVVSRGALERAAGADAQYQAQRQAAAAQSATLLAGDGMRIGPTIDRAKALGIYSGDVGRDLSVSNAPVVALRRSPGENMTAWNGDSGVSAQQMATIRGSWHYQQSANLSEVVADAAIGEGVGMVLRATGRVASATARTFGPTLDNMAFNAMDRMGLVLKAVPEGSGPVVFRAPPGATAEEIAQVKAYVQGSNEALQAGQLSAAGRVSTKGELRTDASLAAAQERARALSNGAAYQGHAGHVPDTTWTGSAQPYQWLDLTPKVNSSLGGQAKRYPLGYQPTEFIFEAP